MEVITLKRIPKNYARWRFSRLLQCDYASIGREHH